MVTTKKEYDILVIEDNQGDFILIEEFLLEKFEVPRITHAKTFKIAKEVFLSRNCPFDIILLDLSLPDKIGEPLIQEIVALCLNTPIIVLTGYSDFSFGLKSLSLGITDYILKDELTALSLFKSIIYSSERKKNIAELEESEKKYSELFHLSPLPMWVLELDSFHFLDVNISAINHYGYTFEEFLSMTIFDLLPIDELAKSDNHENDYKEHQQLYLRGIFRYRKKNGEIIKVDTQSNIIQYKGKKAKVVLANDITERLNYIKAIEEQNEKLRKIAWMQSHVVRAPLAKIMGLIHLIQDLEAGCEDEKEKMLEYILSSAYELDEVIREISDKTRSVDY